MVKTIIQTINNILTASLNDIRKKNNKLFKYSSIIGIDDILKSKILFEISRWVGIKN
jgi:hypothetical protein